MKNNIFKKLSILLLISTALLGSYPTKAYTSCKGGSKETRSGYCISKDSMNWYSAVNWCKANGGSLPNKSTFYHVTSVGQQCWTREGVYACNQRVNCQAASKDEKYRACCI